MAMTMTAAGSNAERRFYQVTIVLGIAATLLGFMRSFLLRPLFPAVHAPTEIYFYLHGVLFVAWLALVLTQVSLVGRGRTTQHQTLGTIAFAMVPVMVVVGLYGSLVAAKRPTGFVDIPAPPLEFLTVPVFGLLTFAILAGAALHFRRDPQTHKRLMLLSIIPLMEAGIARWPFEPFISTPPAAFWASQFILVALIGWDLASRRMLHPATILGGILVVAEGPIRDAVSHTPQWLTFAQWATGLLG